MFCAIRVRGWSVEMKAMGRFKSVFFIFVVNVEYRYPSFLLIVVGYGVNVEKTDWREALRSKNKKCEDMSMK